MDQVYLKAYAKINLGLNMISRRTDGFHNIETVFQEVDLYDLITIKRTNSCEIIVRCDNLSVPQQEGNSCYKAVKLFQQFTGITQGVEIIVNKSIPVGAGLGGGSSDAAAVLSGLQLLWQIRLTLKDLRIIALRLGADVPFFLGGGTALASGRGEILTPIELPFYCYCLLIYPNIEISSTWAYKNFNFSLTKRKKSIKLSQIFLPRMDFLALRYLISNDLEEVVFQQFAILKDLKQLLYRKGAFFTCMSGSGSTIYGLFKNYASAVVVKKSILKPYQIFLAKPVVTANRL